MNLNMGLNLMNPKNSCRSKVMLLCALSRERNAKGKRMTKNHSVSYYNHMSCKNSLESDYERGICNVMNLSRCNP